MPHITTDVEEELILRIATLLGVDGENGVLLSCSMVLQDIVMSTGAEIYGPTSFVAHIIVGITLFPARFVAQFRKLRRAGKINAKTVNIASVGGRSCRPLVIVEHM